MNTSIAEDLTNPLVLGFKRVLFGRSTAAPNGGIIGSTFVTKIGNGEGNFYIGGLYTPTALDEPIKISDAVVQSEIAMMEERGELTMANLDQLRQQVNDDSAREKISEQWRENMRDRTKLEWERTAPHAVLNESLYMDVPMYVSTPPIQQPKPKTAMRIGFNSFDDDFYITKNLIIYGKPRRPSLEMHRTNSDTVLGNEARIRPYVDSYANGWSDLGIFERPRKRLDVSKHDVSMIVGDMH